MIGLTEGVNELAGKIASTRSRIQEIQQQPMLKHPVTIPSFDGFSPAELASLLQKAETRVASNPLLDSSGTCVHIAEFAFEMLIEKGYQPDDIVVYANDEKPNGVVSHAYLVINKDGGIQEIFNHPDWEIKYGRDKYGQARRATDQIQRLVKNTK